MSDDAVLLYVQIGQEGMSVSWCREISTDSKRALSETWQFEQRRNL